MDEPQTPMMQQYLDLKREHQEEVLFFRLGDFYEMFLEDAQDVSRLLNLTLTARNGVPMCGIPHHAARNYVKRLLEAGKKIAIVEQTEMPGPGRPLARREVVQILTPGTVIEDEFLEAGDNNFILCIALLPDGGFSTSHCELSSGVFEMMVISREDGRDEVRNLAEELHPREILVNEDDYFSFAEFASLVDALGSLITKLPSWQFSTRHGFETIASHVGTPSLKQFGIEQGFAGLIAAGALLSYIDHTSNTSVRHMAEFTVRKRQSVLRIDESSRKNLELLGNMQDGSSQRTLFAALNKTRTASGARLLKLWISNPLADKNQIDKRRSYIKTFILDSHERIRIRGILASMPDLQRLTTRVILHRAIPKDVLSIGQALAGFFEIVSERSQWYRTLQESILIDEELERLVELMQDIVNGLQETCQGPFVAGGVIKAGYDQELDSLRESAFGKSDSLSAYLSKLKEETGIPTIKLSSNKIIGHYLEIPKTHASRIPSTFIRKQTLVNAERYTTEDLIGFEARLNASEELAAQKEREIFQRLIEASLSCGQTLAATGRFIAVIDCLQSLATTAIEDRYCEPVISDDDVLIVNGARHPVVEQLMPVGTFVPNPMNLGGSWRRFCLITGPNMAGKSTYLRQCALLVILAHMGSYVPAESAVIGLTDTIFCRVGASDNLARGESTFLVEMQEGAYIARNATSRSLVIMDEIGRGTSTQDGMSIAYAMMRYLVSLGSKTFFATHYHELTMLDSRDITLLTLDVAKNQKGIVFLKRIKEGAATSSYGLYVAKMAGMPESILREASSFQRKHFADYSLADRSSQLELFIDGIAPIRDVQDECDAYLKELDECIKSFPIEEKTPVQVLTFLSRLQDALQKRQPLKDLF